MTPGMCRLCLKASSLRKSHFIPAGIYRQLRENAEDGTDPSTNPNPWEISSVGSVQTNKQMTAHLLCDECETRLSQRGEDWVLKHFLKANGAFKLAEILAQHAPAVQLDTNATKVYLASGIPEIDVAALTYFTASIFWRGSIHPWDRGGIVPVPLGPYAEPMRQYLNGEAEFPENVSLLIAVREGEEISRLTASPFGEKQDGVWVYRFPMPGLALAMAVGRALTPSHRNYCFVRGHGNPIASTPLLEAILERQAVVAYQHSIKRQRQR